MALTTENAGPLIAGGRQKEGSLMKVKFIKNTVAGGVAVEVGQVETLDDAEAKFLIDIGKATEFVEPEPKKAPAKKKTPKKAPAETDGDK